MNDPQRSARRVTGEFWHFAAGVAALAAVTALYRHTLSVSNPTIVGLSYLLVVLLVAAASTLRIAFAISVAGVVLFNYYFLPPVGTLTLDDPENWVALLVFLAVSVVASRLSLTARKRAEEATARRDEMGRLFDLSRDVLLTTDSRDAVSALARYMARRFVLEYVGICLPLDDGWAIHESAPGIVIDRNQLDLALSAARGTLEFDAQARTYGGHRQLKTGDGAMVTLVPLRLGTRAVGLLAASGRPVEPGTLDAMAGLAAVAIERANLLEERKAAELLRQSADLKSALLASLGHDLRTPLTAITVASRNLEATWLTDVQRKEQLDVVLTEVERLNRLFQNIVDMARIETGAVNAELEWVQPSDIVDAAVQQVEYAVRSHPLEIDAASDVAVQVDPRLTSAALAHVIENAGHYSPEGSAITISATVTAQGLLIAVRDRGTGIAPQDQEHLFERFYRGADARRRAFGTGMGLSITRGLLAAQGGQVWAENDPNGGAVFTVMVPAPSRAEISTEPENT
jgi:two-component system sensor histidine kinase KdpD